MLRRAWLIIASFVSVFLLNQPSFAAEINTNTYDIYMGNADDAGSNDFYFVQRPLFVLLHGDISTPLFIQGTANFLMAGNAGVYSAAQSFSLTAAQLATKISTGQLKLAQLNIDVFIWNNGIAGQNNILLRGATASDAALLLMNNFSSLLFPTISKTYSPSTYIGISDRTTALAIKDVNSDGKKDIVLGSFVLGDSAAQIAYLADTTGTPLKFFEVTPSTAKPSTPTVTTAGTVTHVGTTGGQFRVDESGAATYSIPLALAAGVAGVTPKVELNYSSQGGAGILGRGWSLGGLSSIARCRQTLSQDTAAKPLTWSDSDRFCLDGQRLVVITGSYGAVDSTYKTEIDSFVTVTAKGGSAGHPAYFTVTAKDGSTSFYGNSADSKLSGSATLAATTVLSWAINRFEDNVKNGVGYVYTGDASTGLRVSAINYAFPLPGSSANAKASVTFEYETRPDPISAYVAGYLFKQTQRLSKIKVNNNGIELRTFSMFYMSNTTADSRYDNSISRLESVQECKASSCLPPLSFKWGGGSHIAFNHSTEQIDFPNASPDKYILNNAFSDVTGDGKLDLIYLRYEGSYAATTEFPNKSSVTLRVKYAETGESTIFSKVANDYSKIKIANLDYNADGRSDVAYYDGTKWLIYLSSTRPNGTWRIDNSSPIVTDTLLVDKNTVFADFNGDGLADAISSAGYRLLARNGQPDTSSQAYSFATIVPFDWAPITSFPEVMGTPMPTSVDGISSCSEGGVTKAIVPHIAADFNGDGLVDFVGNYSRKINCGIYRGNAETDFRSTTLQFTYALTYSDGKLSNYGSIREDGLSNESYLDINSDGLTDLVYKSSANKYFYKLNNGAGFNSLVEWITLPVYSTDPKMTIPQFIDFNSDGWIDVVWHERMNSVLRVQLWGSTTSKIVLNSSANANDSHFLMDVTGDGIFDYIKISSASLTGKRGTMAMSGASIPCHWENIYNGHLGRMENVCVGAVTNPSVAVPSNEQNNSIVSISNGLGNLTKINYGTLSNSGRYSTTDVNATIVTTTTPPPPPETYCGGYSCGSGTTYITADPSNFYARLNGGWGLPGSSQTLVPLNATKGAPVLEINGAMQIVTSVDSSAPAGTAVPGAVNQTAVSSVNYFYGEAKMQASGRGFLGFNTLKTIDQQTGIATVTTYRQDFPFIGQPLSTVVYADNTATAKVLSTANNTWNFNLAVPDKKSYQVTLQKSMERSYDLNSADTLLQKVVTENVYDKYGNATKITSTTSGKKLDGTDTTFITVTDNVFGTPDAVNDENIYGRLKNSKVTTTRDGATEERTVSFTYYASGTLKNLLETETIGNPDTTGTKKTYEYDQFGNQSKILIKAINSRGLSETRTVTSNYDQANGRNLLSTSNGLNQQAIVGSYNDFGGVVSGSDINGIESKAFHDELGREFMRKDVTGAWSRTESFYCSSGFSCPMGAIYFIVKRAAGGSSATEYFDILGRVIRSSQVSFDGRILNVDTEYDHLSRPLRQSLPFFGNTTVKPTLWVESEYDRLGRVTKVTQPDSTADATPGVAIGTTSYAGYSTTFKNDLNQTRTETRNGLGQLVRVADFVGGTIDYEYDSRGNLLSATTTKTDSLAGDTTPSSVKVRMCYDSFGRKTAMLDPDKGGFSAAAGDSTIACSSVSSSGRAGWWTYEYDGFGELISQRDPKGQRQTMVYDKLGRMIGRTDFLAGGGIEGFTQWFYEKDVNGGSSSILGKVTAVVMNTDPALTSAQITAALNSEVASCSQTNVSCHKTLYNFNPYGQLTDTSVYYPGSVVPYIARTYYDIFGRPSEQYDVLDKVINNTSSGVQTSYNDYGYANKINDIGSGGLLQETLATNERGQVVSEYRGNGVTSTNIYDNLTGQLTDQQSGMGSLFSVQNIHYKWDSIGNLIYRNNQTPFKSGSSTTKNQKESFCYDNLNRLVKTSAGVTSPSCSGAQDITYNGMGNIIAKSGVGNYSYGSNAGPHAVTSTSNGASYYYDNNGNLNNQTGNGARTIAYSSYDQPTVITKNGATTKFSYGPGRDRWQRQDIKNGVTTTTQYLGNVERITVSNTPGEIEWKRYIGGAIFTYKTNASNQLLASDKSFVYNDHLGSLDVVTNSVGVIQQSLSFDAWGARRNGENWSAFVTSEIAMINTLFKQPITTRGFTGHEMVDDMGLIHMNGRIYDPLIARFLQADPFIQAATSTQSYNRYSYVLNNPLNKIDPSGYNWFGDIFKGLLKLNGTWALLKFLNNHVAWSIPFIAVALNFIPGIGVALSQAFLALNAFYVSGGSLNAGARSLAISTVTQGLNGVAGGIQNTAGQMLASATVGGIMAELQGGKFGHGFVSAGIMAGTGGIGGTGVNSSIGGLMASTIISGTVSEMTGGKFRNGARTGAMNYLTQWAASEIMAGGKQAPAKSAGGTCSSNPINIATGEKYLTMTDYHAEGASQMVFERHYSSYANEKSSLGVGWRSNFDRNLKLEKVGDTTVQVTAIRHQGDPIRFNWIEGDNGQAGNWVTDSHRYETIRKTDKGWELQLTDNSREIYDDAGYLISIKKIDGYQQTLTYGNQGTVKNVLLSVEDNFGQRLTFTYDLSARMLSMTANDVSTTRYMYDLADNLVKVISPDNTPNDIWDNSFKIYDYEDKRFTHAITGIRTSDGQRIHSMAYDAQGHAVLSALGDNVERVDMAFSQGENNTKQTVVKNSLGKNTTYTFDQQNKPLMVEGNPTASCIGSNQGYQYNDNGQLTSKTDWNGSTTQYEYNERGLETLRVESAGTPQEHLIATVWHSEWRLPVQITKADLVVEFSYNNQGMLVKRLQRDTKTERSSWQQLLKQYPEREWSYAYNAQGLLIEVDGSRTDVNDITRFEYDAKGNRIAVINALGHRSEVLAVNERGLPLQVRDANGVVTDLVYNSRGWLISKTLTTEQGKSTTHYTYTGESDYKDAGLVSAVTLPNGQQVRYEYDAARRLVAQSNNAGESIKYTLDLEGNRLTQAIYGSGGELMNSQRQVFDELGRMLQSIGADGSSTHFGYDKAGNRISASDALGNKTAYAYDALNRLMATTDAANGVVAQAYDQADRITAITDQRGLITQYQYNGFGNKIAQISPDTGETRFAYDQAGNLISKRDARGKVTQYTYDAIGRMLNVLYPATNDDNIHYSYDSQQGNSKGIGRLANVSDASGTQSYSYNAMGQITEQLYKLGDIAYAIGYDYDRNGQLNSLRYPSGRVVSYGYDAEGNIASVTTASNGAEQALVNQIARLPFGPVAGFTYGNGARAVFNHDQSYRLRDARVTTLAVNDAAYDRHYDYDATSNIIAITDRKATARSQQFNYDALYRLTNATGSYGQTTYHYDAVGNRTAREQNGKLEAYSYADNSNRLLTVVSEGEQGQLQARNLSYDAVGNITRDSVDGTAKQLSYGENNRLQQVDIANKQVAGYEHNAKGQRVIKRVDGKVIHFHYNTADQLIAETDASGQPIREYLYGVGQRLALVDYTRNKSGDINYMVNDHLGTPQLLLDANQQVVWSVDQSPFGEVKTEGDVEQPLRFPGQYADAETGYSYNYFRDYDPSLGRYIESDPIGLEGGVNTFGYVNANSINRVDPLGLMDLGGSGMMCGVNPNDALAQQYSREAESSRLISEASNYSLVVEGQYGPYAFNGSWNIVDGYVEQGGFATGSGFEFNLGVDYKVKSVVTNYNLSGGTITLSSTLPFVPFVGGTVEYKDNALNTTINFRLIPGKPIPKISGTLPL